MKFLKKITVTVVYESNCGLKREQRSTDNKFGSDKMLWLTSAMASAALIGKLSELFTFLTSLF